MAIEEQENGGVKLTRMSELRHRRQRKKIRSMMLLAALLTAAVFYFTGTYAGAFSALADAAESVQIFLNRSGSFPVSTGIAEPLQVQVLSGGFVELGQDDVLVYSGSGAALRSIQHGYARPAVSVGSSRFCIYNRGGTELRIESRTRSLYSKKFSENILLCQMSQNGSVAVVTQSSRFVAVMEVYPPSLGDPYRWETTKAEGTPVRVAFASDNHRLAAGCISAENGQLSSRVYLLDTYTEEVTAVYQADSGSALLNLEWISGSQLLCVYDGYACVLNPSTGEEKYRFSYDGATVTSVSVYGRTTALLLSTRAGSRLAVLDDKMKTLLDQNISTANRITVTHNSVYLVRDSSVERVNLKGESQWVQSYSAEPRLVLNADELLLFVDSGAQILTAPPEED